MTHAHSDLRLPAPDRLQVPSRVKTAAAAAVLIGMAALAWAFASGRSDVAWTAYLIGAFFALGLGVFGVLWLAILYLAGATWSVTMRRIPEAMSAWLLPGGLLALGVALGAPTLYHWAQPEIVATDALLAHKAPFLNLPLFLVFGTISFLLWAGFATMMVGASHRQDRTGGMAPTRSNRVLSAVFLVIFALTISVVSFYFLLSLDAHWFSTMFAVLVFTDIVQTGTAFVALVASLCVAAGLLRGFLTAHHLHSLGKMVFAATGFWAYIYFCQFMLIWYANIPEETAYFLRRSEHGWLAYLLLLPVVKFLIPFVALLSREAKRRATTLVPVAFVILFAQFLELFVMVAPAVGHAGDGLHARLPLVELAATFGFFGLFVLVFGWQLARHDAVPLKDPALAECLQYQS
jgi:hypothetical protein